MEECAALKNGKAQHCYYFPSQQFIDSSNQYPKRTASQKSKADFKIYIKMKKEPGQPKKFENEEQNWKSHTILFQDLYKEQQTR